MSTPVAPTPARGVAGAPGATLSRELADFLVEFSIALHKHAIYPPTHPLLARAVDQAAGKLWGLLADRAALSIGVARRQLVIEGVATDPNHPLLQELAQKLHRHHLGAVKFLAGIGREELGDLLGTLGMDAARLDTPLGLDSAMLGDRWEHARLFPLTYDKLELLDDDPDAPAEGQMKGGRAAQLWVGLARAALASEGDAVEAESLEPAVVARAIDEHQREQAYDQVIVGYLLQIATELRSAQGAEAAALQRRIARLVGALREDTLTRLLEMGGDGRQRRKFVSDAAAGMSVDAVVDLVKAAAEAEKQSISHSMVRLLSKLAKHADEGPERRRTEADRSLREAVMRLINDWSLNDPNPDAYREVLETISRQTAIENTSAIPVEVEAERLVQMGLEIGVVGLPVWRAVDRLYADQRIARLLDLLDGAPEPAVAEQIWQNLNERGALHDLLSAERPDMAVVERLVRRAGLGAAMPLLDAMESLEDSKLRERVGELLVSLGEATMPFIVRRLDGARAATVRDLLVVLGAFPRLPEGLDLTEYLTHADVMVRREAVKLALREPEWRDTAISTAVSDADQRVVYLALLAAQERCPRQAVDVVRGRVERGDFDAPLRALGVRVAATVRTPDTLAWLVARATTRTRWFKRLRMLPSAPEVIAAVNAIALGWKDDPAAAALLSLAKKSKEGELRQAATSPRASLTMRATDPRGMDAIAR